MQYRIVSRIVVPAAVRPGAVTRPYIEQELEALIGGKTAMTQCVKGGLVLSWHRQQNY